MSEYLKDVVAIAVAVALVTLVLLPVGRGTYRLQPDRDTAIRVAAGAEAPGRER